MSHDNSLNIGEPDFLFPQFSCILQILTNTEITPQNKHGIHIISLKKS